MLTPHCPDPHPQEWHDERRTGIGGSDAPIVVLGRLPFNDSTTWRTLWEDKMGISLPIEPNASMMRGICLEDTVANLYAQQTKRKLWRQNQILRHPDHPFMICNRDRLIVGDERGLGVLEIKCPGSWNFGKIKREGIPDYYQIQLYHYMAWAEIKWGAFAVFNADAWELIHFDVAKDPEMIEIIIQKEAEFWEYVKAGTPPPEDTVSSVPVPELPAINGEVKQMAGEDWEKALAELWEAKQIKDEAEILENNAKAQLQALMGEETQIAEGTGTRIYWQYGKGRESFNHKKFVKDHPHIDCSGYYSTAKPLRSFKTYKIKEARTQ